MKIKYEFADGTVSEVEVEESIGEVIIEDRRQEDNLARKERYLRVDNDLEDVKALTGYVQGMADRFNSLTDAQQNAIIKVLAIVAAVGPAILIFGKMVTGVGRAVSTVGKLGKAIRAAGSVMGLLTSPAGVVIAVIAGIALAAGLIYKNWDTGRRTGSGMCPIP